MPLRVPILKSIGKAAIPLIEKYNVSPVALKYVEEVIIASPLYAKYAGVATVVVGVGVYIALPETGKQVTKKVGLAAVTIMAETTETIISF